LSEDGAIKRALERIQGKRRLSFSKSEDEYALREFQFGDESEDMGCEVLRILMDLHGEAFDAFSLFMNASEGKITVYKRSFWKNLLLFREEYRIGEGGITYELSGPEDGAHMCKDVLNRGEIKLGSPDDFRKLNYDSVKSLHTYITSEDFMERLAWMYGRQGKPGYSAEGFEEEQQTWKLANEDPPKRSLSRTRVEK
jgi:hypothetical protein